jgi:hypothetical protein
LQILLNQDSGTGRVVKVSMQGFTGAGAFFRRWLSQMPNEISREMSLVDPGTPVQQLVGGALGELSIPKGFYEFVRA